MADAVKMCGKVRKGKPPCEKPAGAGTEHPGRGPCRLHGGNLPNVVKHYEQEAAVDYAKDTIGESSIDPLEAMLKSVRVADALLNYWQAQITSNAITAERLGGVKDSAIMLNRFAKAALDADVNGRLVALAERAADPYVLAAEEALDALQAFLATPLSVEARTAYAQAYQQGMARFEGEPVTIEGRARELPA